MQQTINELNSKILELQDEARNQISDGYHTFGELYEHRCRLFIALVNMSGFVTDNGNHCIKSKIHFDGTSWDGWFIVQGYIAGKQISYHLPIKYRDNVRCQEKEIADERDGHTSNDVLERLLWI